MIEKVNPFLEAISSAGYSTIQEFVDTAKISRAKINYWLNKGPARIYDSSMGDFRKMCDAMHITVDQGKMYIANLHHWRNDKNVKIVKPEGLFPTGGDTSKRKKCTHTAEKEPIMYNPLRDWRMHEHMTIQEAASMFGYSDNDWIIWETGVGKIPDDALEIISNFTDISKEDIRKLYSDNTSEVTLPVSSEVTLPKPGAEYDDETIIDVLKDKSVCTWISRAYTRTYQDYTYYYDTLPMNKVFGLTVNDFYNARNIGASKLYKICMCLDEHGLLDKFESPSLRMFYDERKSKLEDRSQTVEIVEVKKPDPAAQTVEYKDTAADPDFDKPKVTITNGTVREEDAAYILKLLYGKVTYDEYEKAQNILKK